MRIKMKNVFQKKNLIILAVVVFIAAVSAPVVFAQTTEAGIRFVSQLSRELNSGSISGALTLFDSIPDELKDDTDMMVLKSSLLLSAGRNKEADELASGLLLKEPKNLDVLELNMMIAKQKGDKAKKSTLIRQIVTLDPNNVAANIERADEQALKKNWRNARDYYKKALAKDGENTEALFGYGKMCYYMEKDDDAKEAFNKLIQLEPLNPQANAYLAKYAAESSQYRKAVEYVEKAIKYDPTNTDFYFDLGTYRRFTGDYKGAEEAWKKAVSLEPDYFLGYAYLAGLYDEENRTDLALEYYRKVIEKNPKYYYAYESLGMFAWGKGNWEEAQGAFEKARSQNPDSLSYILMIAACQYKQNKVQDARKFLELVMKKISVEDRKKMEYKMIRMYHDKGGDAEVALGVTKETNRTKKGRYLYYLALYYELINKDNLAHKYYTEVAGMQSPMFFEYRMAQWKVQ